MPRKPALGKGLEALIPPTRPAFLPESLQTEPSSPPGAEPQGMMVREVLLTDIRPNPNQPRKSFRKDELDELAHSIAEHGILQPLLVQKTPAGGYELVSGERRLRAAELAGLATVPVIVVDPGDPLSAFTIALVENVQRADLNPIELADAFKRLQEEYGLSHEDIARIVGKSRPYVTNTMRLLELPEQIQKAVAEGKLSAGHARALLGAPPESAPAILALIIEKDLSVRQTERAVRALSASQSRPAGSKREDPADAVVIQQMKSALESTLKRKVAIIRGKRGRGKIVLDFYSDSDLVALVDRLAREL